jgi:class 3 adenylate cyclase
VRTLHGQGYRFVAAVEEWEHLPVDAAPPTLPLHGVAGGTHQTVLSSPPLAPSFTDPHSITVEAPGGEHKQVTVLCGALAEPSALAAGLGPEAMYHLMREVLALVQDTVQHYEGILLQVSGEGFVALFGAPVAQEDHARRAVLAALELSQRLRAPDAIQGQLHGVTVRLGLHTGPVIVGHLAHDPQRPYTASGDTLRLATLLQQQAVPQAARLPAQVQRSIVARGAGNPFFLEELVWAVADHDIPAQPPALPATVQAVLAARIDRLPPEEKRLLQTAAVIGREVPLGLLQRIAGLPEDTLYRALVHFQQRSYCMKYTSSPSRSTPSSMP